MGEPNKVEVEFGVKVGELSSGMNQAKNVVKAQTDQIKTSLDSIGTDSAKKITGAFAEMTAGIDQSLGVSGQDLSKFGEAANDASNLAKEGFAGIPPALKLVAGSILAVGVAAVGLLALKGAAKGATEFTEKSLDLGRALGISATKASIWMAVLDDVGATTGELEAASKGLTRGLVNNEADMNRMGLVTRDAKGELLGMDDIMKGAIATVNTYSEGTDRNMAAQAIFGRGVQGNSKLLLANAEVIKTNEDYMRSLGGVVGTEAIAAWEAFDSANDKLGLGMTVLRNTIGNAVAPVLAKLLEMLADLLPAAITIARGALGGLVTAFWLVRNGVVVVWETINAMIVTLAEPLRAFAEAMYKAVTGDWDGAKNAIIGVGKVITGSWGNAMDNMVKSSEETTARIAALFNTTDAPEPGKGGKKFEGEPDKPKKEKAEKEKAERDPASLMSQYVERLELEKLFVAQEGDLREYKKSQEIQYWKTVLDHTLVNAKDREAIALKIAKLEVEILRQAAREQQEITRIKGEEAKSVELDRIEQLQTLSKEELAIGAITKEEYLVSERAFMADKLAAELAFVGEKAALAQLDPEKNLVLLEQLEAEKAAIRRRYSDEMLDNSIQTAQAARAPMESFGKSLEGSFANTFSRIGSSIISLGGLVRALWSNVASAVMGAIGKMAAEWVVKNLFMKAVSKASAVSEISTESAKAGAGGVASMAAAPFPLNLGAPAFGASMAALAGSFAIASAAQGFDIPAGMNPITQLHQREMVLPEKHADVIRGLADDGNGGGGGGSTVIMNITTPNADSFRRSQRQIDRDQSLAFNRR